MQQYANRRIVEPGVRHTLFEERCGGHITTATAAVKTRLESSYTALDNLKLDILAQKVQSVAVMNAWKTASFIFDALARSLHADAAWWITFECSLALVVMLLRQSNADTRLIALDGNVGPEKHK